MLLSYKFFALRRKVYYRVEILKEGEWVGIFRVDYINPLDKQRDWEASNEMDRYIFRELECPNLEPCEPGSVQSWFTQLGWERFQLRQDLFLQVLAEEKDVSDIRVLERESLSKEHAVHYDRHQMIVMKDALQ